MKKYLFVMRQAPHLSNRLQEALDQLLTIAAFDQQVELLFIDDGVLQLKTHQNPGQLGARDTAAVFNALALYGVERLLLEAESLQERALSAGDLLLPVELVPRAAIAYLLSQYDVIVPD